MKKGQSKASIPQNNSGPSEKDGHQMSKTSSDEEMLQKWHNEIALLSYEDSLNALDELLDHLQNDTVPVEDLQKYYLQGKIYLDHCQDLLNNTEQEIINYSPEKLKEVSEE